MIPPPATAPIAHRQKRLQTSPLFARQITATSHTKLTGQMIGQAWLLC